MNVSSGWSGNPIRRISRPHQILQCPIKLSLIGEGPGGLGNILTDIPEFQTGRIGNSKPAGMWGAQRIEEIGLEPDWSARMATGTAALRTSTMTTCCESTPKQAT